MDPDKANPQDEKPIEPVVETPVVEETPEFSNEDLHKESFKDIAVNKEIPEEKKEEEKPEDKKPEEEEKPEEKEEEVEVDPKEMAKQIAEEIKEANKEEVKEEPKDPYEVFFEKTKAEKGREPNWVEVSKFIQEQAKADIKHEQEEAQKVADEQKETEKKATEELTKRFNATIDEELDELYSKGELTPIKDKSNPNDQGVVERKSLFAKMLEVNQQRASENKPPIMSLMRIKYGYWTKPNAQPAGESAPISMGHGSSTSNDDNEEVDYQKDIHRPWSFFKKTV